MIPESSRVFCFRGIIVVCCKTHFRHKSEAVQKGPDIRQTRESSSAAYFRRTQAMGERG